jgi:hypothetical protein
MQTTEASSDRNRPDRRRRATALATVAGAVATAAVVTGTTATAALGDPVLALISLNHNETIIRSGRRRECSWRRWRPGPIRTRRVGHRRGLSVDRLGDEAALACQDCRSASG